MEKLRIVLTSQYLDLNIEKQEEVTKIEDAIKNNVAVIKIDKHVVVTKHIQALIRVEEKPDVQKK